MFLLAEAVVYPCNFLFLENWVKKENGQMHRKSGLDCQITNMDVYSFSISGQGFMSAYLVLRVLLFI